MKDRPEYKIDLNGYIIGWRMLPLKKRPDLKDVGYPLPEMNISLVDEYGLYKYKLIDNAPTIVLQTPSVNDIANNEYTKTEMTTIIRQLMDGIENGKNSVEYTKLKLLMSNVTKKRLI